MAGTFLKTCAALRQAQDRRPDNPKGLRRVSRGAWFRGMRRGPCWGRGSIRESEESSRERKYDHDFTLEQPAEKNLSDGCNALRMRSGMDNGQSNVRATTLN